MRDALQRAWMRRGAIAFLLAPAALVYGTLIWLRRRLHAGGVLRGSRFPVPVIVVGNVVAGGAGKTPLLLSLVAYLQGRGWRPGVVSRGYGRRGGGCREATPDSNAAEVGDEPLLIARACGCPVFVAARRADACEALLARHPRTDVIFSDDGLQHLALERDIEICVFDDRGTGNGWLLPAGPLREPWPRPVDLIVHTGTSPAFEGFRAPRRLAPFACRGDGTRIELAALRGVPFTALAGVAVPESFFAMLRAAGISLERTLPLPDHYDFDSAKPLWEALDSLICTEKDAVKLWRTRPDALAVPLKTTPEPALLEALERLLRPHAAPPLSSKHGQQAA